MADPSSTDEVTPLSRQASHEPGPRRARAAIARQVSVDPAMLRRDSAGAGELQRAASSSRGHAALSRQASVVPRALVRQVSHDQGRGGGDGSGQAAAGPSMTQGASSSSSAAAAAAAAPGAAGAAAAATAAVLAGESATGAGVLKLISELQQENTLLKQRIADMGKRSLARQASVEDDDDVGSDDEKEEAQQVWPVENANTVLKVLVFALTTVFFFFFLKETFFFFFSLPSPGRHCHSSQS